MLNFRTMFMAAFAKPMLCAGRIISTKFNLKTMTEFTFRFYGNEKHLNTRTFHTETIEEAYIMADNVLRQTPKYDDWECLLPSLAHSVSIYKPK